MRLFNKTIDRQLFKQYSLGSDLSKQEVVAKIFNPMGAGTWFILNSDPQDPDYLWAIVDLGYGAEVGSVSRSELENYRGRFGLGFERDLSFDPINAEELYQGLRQGEYYSHGGETEERIKQELASLDPRIKLLSELSPKEEGYEGIKELVEKRNALQAKLLNLKGGFADGGQIEVVYERRADFKKKPIKLLLLSRGKEQKGYTFSGKDQVAVLDNYNRNKQEDLEKLWNLKGYETKYANGGEVSSRLSNNFLIVKIKGKTYKTWFPNWLSINKNLLEKLNKENKSVLIVEEENGNSKQFEVPNRDLMDIWLNDKSDKKTRDVLIQKAIEYNNNSFADGGSIDNYDVVIDGDWDEPKKFRTFSLAKKWIYQNAKNYESLELVDPYGDTIFVEGNSTKEDLDWLFSNDEVSAFAKGGNIADFSDNQLMIMNQNVEVEHHHEELEDILEDKVPVPAWVVAKMETATQNLSDITHYLDGEKEIAEDQLEEEDDEDEMEAEEIENKEVVEPIVVTAGDKTEITKNFTDDAWDNLRGFLKGMEGIDLRDDYTFDYKDEQYEVEPIINSDENGVSNAVFTIFDGDGEEVGEVAYSREGGKQKFTANSEFFSWNNAKFEDGGYFDGAIPKTSSYMSNYAKGGMVVTSVKDIPNFKERLEQRRITYRGLGMGKVADDFYKLAGTSGTRIKVDGKEYFITDEEFDTFSRDADGKMQIRFDAPARKGYADGGFMNGVYEDGGFLDKYEVDRFKQVMNGKAIAKYIVRLQDSFGNKETYVFGIKIKDQFKGCELVPYESLYGGWSNSGTAFSLDNLQVKRLVPNSFSEIELDEQETEMLVNKLLKNNQAGVEKYLNSAFFYLSYNQSFKDVLRGHLARSVVKIVSVEFEIAQKFADGGFMNNVYDKGGNVGNEFDYRLLSRLVSDCDYYLGNGNRSEKHLWAGNVDGQIKKMKELWNGFPKNAKPEWLSMEDILDYEKKMKNQYAKGGNIKNYILKADIKTVTVKRKGKEVTYNGADVLNGAHVLAKGGDITSKANYVGKNDVVEVELKDGSKVKPANGYWIKKGAEPISNEPTPTTSVKSEPKVGETVVKKGAYGWSATTNIDDFNDYDWRVSTFKTSSGQLLTSAKGGKSEQGNGYTTFKYTLYEDPYHTLEVSKPSRLTDKVVSEQHAKGLAKFKKFMETGTFGRGGKISNFDKLSAKVAKNYEGKPVKNKYQEEYGKYYSKEEAQEVGDKVAGKMKAMTADKKENGGRISMKLANELAKEIRKDGESWNDAKKRAFAQLKK